MSRVIPSNHATPPQAAPGSGTGERGIPHVRKGTGDAVLGRKLRELRERDGRVLKQAAFVADVTPAAMSAYERGARMPSVSVLARLCRFYNVSPRYLIIEARRQGLPCEGCGLTPSNPHGYVVYEVPQGAPERCGTCGRQKWFVIEVREVGGEG